MVEARLAQERAIDATVEARLAQERAIEATVEATLNEEKASMPTATPNPTYTPVATATSVPTPTPVATATSVPTPTPVATATSVPTPTPTPIPTPTLRVTPRPITTSSAELLAKFAFNDSPDNSVPGGNAMYLENTSYENQALRVNGNYYYGDSGSGYLADVYLPDLDFESFSMSADFLVETSTEINYSGLPIVVGGSSYRWFSIYLNSDDELGISLNNSDYSIPSRVKIDRDAWYNVTGTFDLDNKKVELYLGTERIIDHTLPSDFNLDVLVDGVLDYEITLTNYSNGTAFKGLLDNLSIWIGITSGTPNPESYTPTPTPSFSRVPTPTPSPANTPSPSVTTRSYGTINMGLKDIGIFEGHPSLTSAPRIQPISSSIGEGLITIGYDISADSMLAKSWSVSEDFSTWTWNFQKDVQFHKGWGEMNASDVLYSYQQWNAGGRHNRSGIIGDYFNGTYGLSGSTIIDDYTLVVNPGTPWIPHQVFEFMNNGGGSSSWVVSKKQSEEIGIEAASRDIAATGPWEIQEHAAGEYWRMSAVEDHWRQSPYFDELVYWEIYQESARLAGFQTGQLDSFDMSFDSISAAESVEGAVLVGWMNAGQAGLNFYGQLYGLDNDGNEYEHYDPTLAWVSSDLDTDSQAWKDAVNVRKALNIAIDRQTIVDTILRGFGAAQSIRDWMGHEARANPDWVYPYDPELAKQMLVEAGYPDGFEITLTPAIRGAPGEIEACEAVAQYWENIGVDVNFQLVPYATIRPELITRKYQGVTCHTVGIRMSPITGATNYLTKNTFSYGTYHPWMEEHISDASVEVDTAKLAQMERDIYDWMFDNALMSSIFTHDGIWPIGPRLDPAWSPTDYREIRTATAFEYAKPR